MISLDVDPAGNAGPARDHRAFPDAATRVATLVVLGAVPIVCAAFFLIASFEHETLAYDYRHAYLPAAEAVLARESPYVDVDDPRLAAETAYVYPPPFAYALTPLTALSENAASVVVTLLGLGLVASTLLLLGVRDWRCFGATLLWAPVLIGLQTGSSSLFLGFGAALAWRFRDRVWPLSASVGLAVAVKLLVWPLLAWMLATRRSAATAGAIAIGAGAALISWAALDFEDLGRYPELLRRLAELEAEESYSLVGISAALGLGEQVGLAISFVAGGALLAACVGYGRRGDDLRSFTFAIAAALAFTPIVWQHYLVLLLPPLAVLRPRFSAIWLVPVLLWLAPREDNGVPVQTLLPALASAALIGYLVAKTPPATRERFAE